MSEVLVFLLQTLTTLPCSHSAAGVITVQLFSDIPGGLNVTCRAINYQASLTYAQFYPTGANYQVGHHAHRAQACMHSSRETGYQGLF